jgi:hypothetical protein
MTMMVIDNGKKEDLGSMHDIVYFGSDKESISKT